MSQNCTDRAADETGSCPSRYGPRHLVVGGNETDERQAVFCLKPSAGGRAVLTASRGGCVGRIANSPSGDNRSRDTLVRRRPEGRRAPSPCRCPGRPGYRGSAALRFMPVPSRLRPANRRRCRLDVLVDKRTAHSLLHIGGDHISPCGGIRPSRCTSACSMLEVPNDGVYPETHKTRRFLDGNGTARVSDLGSRIMTNPSLFQSLAAKPADRAFAHHVPGCTDAALGGRIARHTRIALRPANHYFDAASSARPRRHFISRKYNGLRETLRSSLTSPCKNHAVDRFLQHSCRIGKPAPSSGPDSNPGARARHTILAKSTSTVGRHAHHIVCHTGHADSAARSSASSHVDGALVLVDPPKGRCRRPSSSCRRR